MKMAFNWLLMRLQEIRNKAQQNSLRAGRANALLCGLRYDTEMNIIKLYGRL